LSGISGLLKTKALTGIAKKGAFIAQGGLKNRSYAPAELRLF